MPSASSPAATASGGVATFSGLTLTKAASGYTLKVTGGNLAAAVAKLGSKRRRVSKPDTDRRRMWAAHLVEA